MNGGEMHKRDFIESQVNAFTKIEIWKKQLYSQSGTDMRRQRSNCEALWHEQREVIEQSSSVQKNIYIRFFQSKLGENFGKTQINQELDKFFKKYNLLINGQ